MRSLCIVSRGYPHLLNPISFPFVQQFAHAVARQGIRTSVIAPLPIHVVLRSRDPVRTTETLPGGQVIDIFHPRYLSLSSRQVMRWNTMQLGFESFCRSVRHVLKTGFTTRLDALYGHFMYMGGAAAVRMGAEMGIPAFPLAGEGMLNTVDAFGKNRACRHFAKATAFMANSTCLARQLQQDFGISQETIGVFPNGMDHRVFYPRDRAKMRQKLGLPESGFLVICVGFQDIQKGPVRVGDAIRGLDGVYGIFLGKGPNPPRAGNIIVNKPVPHEQVPEWLSAADVFVLPSTYEGCCNAALEAMSCGLPVIASAGAFNDDILNPDVSIRTDPMDVGAIRSAIVRLRDDRDLLSRMGSTALKWSKKFDADHRARCMLNFMAEQTNRRQS